MLGTRDGAVNSRTALLIRSGSAINAVRERDQLMRLGAIDSPAATHSQSLRDQFARRSAVNSHTSG
jgi:hypothetical protein